MAIALKVGSMRIDGRREIDGKYNGSVDVCNNFHIGSPCALAE